MSRSPDPFDTPPRWLWLSFIPVIGGLAIARAGKETENQSWISAGLAFSIISFLLLFGSPGRVATIWFAQVGMGVFVRQRLGNHPALLENRQRQLAPKLTRPDEKIDINTCSKHDLVHKLGLPIVYANDIDAVRQEGHIFTHIEELSELAGLPEVYQRNLAPLVTFSYDIHKEIDISWRRLNYYSEEEFINEGIDPVIVKRILDERERNGPYRSAIEVRNRAGVPLKSYQNLL